MSKFNRLFRAILSEARELEPKYLNKPRKKAAPGKVDFRPSMDYLYKRAASAEWHDSIDNNPDITSKDEARLRQMYHELDPQEERDVRLRAKMFFARNPNATEEDFIRYIDPVYAKKAEALDKADRTVKLIKRVCFHANKGEYSNAGQAITAKESHEMTFKGDWKDNNILLDIWADRRFVDSTTSLRNINCEASMSPEKDRIKVSFYDKNEPSEYSITTMTITKGAPFTDAEFLNLVGYLEAMRKGRKADLYMSEPKVVEYKAAGL